MTDSPFEDNPYAAPLADLTNDGLAGLPRESLLGERFRRSALRMLGLTRCAGGIFGIVLSVVTLTLWINHVAEIAAVPAAILFGLLGIWNCLAGLWLSRCHHSGRRLSMGECLLQILAAIVLMAAVPADAGFGTKLPALFLGMLAMAWNGSYLFIMFSRTTRQACRAGWTVADLEQRRRPHILFRTVAEFGLILYGGLGAFLGFVNLSLVVQSIVR